MDGVLEACEEATRFHDKTTSAVNHEDQMAGQSENIKVLKQAGLPSVEVGLGLC